MRFAQWTQLFFASHFAAQLDGGSTNIEPMFTKVYTCNMNVAILHLFEDFYT